MRDTGRLFVGNMIVKWGAIQSDFAFIHDGEELFVILSAKSTLEEGLQILHRALDYAQQFYRFSDVLRIEQLALSGWAERGKYYRKELIRALAKRRVS